MKKVILIVAALLMGAATQAQRPNDQELQLPAHRYYNSDEILFVENGVLYKVDTFGDFDFKVLRQRDFRRRGRMNSHINYVNAPGHDYTWKRGRRAFVKTDRFGRVWSVGNTLITYQRNGKVKRIGSVRLFYKRGRLVRIGNMKLIYNRFGRIKRTLGSINRFNHNFWHDDWYSSNTEYFGTAEADDWSFRNTRKRKKEF